MREIFERRSIRKYTGEHVEDDKLRKLLAAAMCAPSAGNERPWHFLVFRDRDMLEKLHNNRPYSQMLPEADCAILVCGDTGRSRYPEDYWVQDCAAATQNILTEGVHLGLGCVWLGVYPTQSTIEYLQQCLGIPEHVIPFSIVSIGYPAEEKSAKDRFDPSRVHTNGW